MEKYNGYTNYETWNVCLWIDNDESIYREKLIRLNYGSFNSDMAEEFAREIFPKGTPDFDSVKDYDKVNWVEVAECFNQG
jgi:hypothetical protein